MLIAPRGIDAVKPRLSWQIFSDNRGIEQTAYQVMVASTKEKLSNNNFDIWNSGKISSDQSIHVAYSGPALKSRQECFWKVKLWTNKGDSIWSESAYWSMGLLNKNDWKAKWTGLDRSFPWDSITQLPVCQPVISGKILLLPKK